MKIKHYASSWPFSLKIPFTDQEKKFFRFLELSKDFEKQILEIRIKYDIPPKGFSFLREGEIGLGIPKYLDYDKWNKYLEDESSISDQFGFVGTWDLSLSYFIKYNYMPKLAETITPRAAIFDGETTFKMLQNDYPALRKRKVFLGLRQRLSKEQLKALIDLQWNQIGEQMKHLPVWDSKKHTKLNIYKDISLLKKRGKAWNEIASTLWDKYPGDDRVLDETYLRTLYSRYSRRLKSLTKSPVSLRPPYK